MMRVASRITSSSGREPLNTSTAYRTIPHDRLNYLYQNSLQRTLGEFREHHKACSVRRKGAAAIEAQKEMQRTEYLAKKYMETVRQDHTSSTSTIPIGLATNSTNHPSSQISTGGPPTSSIPMSSNSGSVKSDEGKESLPLLSNVTSEMNHSTTTAASLSSPMSDTPPSNSQPPVIDSKKDISIKSEPLSNGETPPSSSSSSSSSSSCSQSQSSTNVARVSSGGIISRSNSAGKVRSRLRQSSKDFIQRSLSLSQSTPISNDNDNDDLTFTADDAYRLGTPLKPLEEGTTISNIAPPPRKITPPPNSTTNHTSQTNTAHSTTNGSCSTVATPTCTSSLTTAVSSAENSLLMELDAFTKVMNQVEQNEKAKEMTQRRTSCTSQHRVIESPSHLMSPPPYHPIGGGSMYPATGSQPPNVMPAKQCAVPSRIQNCYDSVYQPATRMDSFVAANICHGPPGIHTNASGIHGNTANMHVSGNPDTRYRPVLSTASGDSGSPHLPLQHPSTHGQIGALLQSPACSQSPSYETLNHTYSLPSPGLHPSYPLWDSQMGVRRVSGGVSQSFGGGSGPPLNPRAGQKRNSISSVYMPQLKVAHSTISHMPDVVSPQLSSEPLQNFQTHPGAIGPAHISSYPPSATSYSHMS